MIRFEIKQLFFDSPKVVRAVDRTTRRVLSKFGAFVRRTARSSIRKRKRISEPGSPPSSHSGLLKKFIFFGYDPTGTTEVKIFLGGTEAYQQTIDLSAGGTLSARFYGFSDFNSGTTVNYEAFINGGLPVATGNFTWSGTNENYINLYSNYTDDNARLDNFEVIAVPEPSSLAMLCMSSVGLYLLRRRSRA